MQSHHLYNWTLPLLNFSLTSSFRSMCSLLDISGVHTVKLDRGHVLGVLLAQPGGCTSQVSSLICSCSSTVGLLLPCGLFDTSLWLDTEFSASQVAISARWAHTSCISGSTSQVGLFILSTRWSTHGYTLGMHQPGEPLHVYVFPAQTIKWAYNS